MNISVVRHMLALSISSLKMTFKWEYLYILWVVLVFLSFNSVSKDKKSLNIRQVYLWTRERKSNYINLIITHRCRRFLLY